MSDPSLLEIMDALAKQIDDSLGTAVEGIQVVGRLETNPTPPCVDIYPADPFQEQTAFMLDSREMKFTIRARVTTADHQAGQDLLLSLMDVRADSSLAATIYTDQTLGGKVAQASIVDGPSAYGQYADSGGEGDLLGCQWTAMVIL